MQQANTDLKKIVHQLGGKSSFGYVNYPAFDRYLAHLSGHKARLYPDQQQLNRDIPNEAENLQFPISEFDISNFQIMREKLGIELLEDQLKREFEIMETIQQGNNQDGVLKNRRNTEKLFEIRELHNILVYFMMVLYHKFSVFVGPRDINNNQFRGSTPTFYPDSKISEILEELSNKTSAIFNKIMDIKYPRGQSKQILDNVFAHEKLEQQQTFQDAKLIKKANKKKQK